MLFHCIYDAPQDFPTTIIIDSTNIVKGGTIVKKLVNHKQYLSIDSSGITIWA